MKFSIITINLNNAVGLKKTIESVISQNFTDFEYIVIDGDSSDGSKDIIQQHHNQITYWISEKDSGIYNAMNKGIKVAKGEFILFLNSGDYLAENNVLEQVNELLNPDNAICTGDILLDRDEKMELHKNPEFISAEHMIFRNISHQSTFIRKNLFYKYGFYDEAFKIAADWVFFFKVLIIGNEKYKKIPICISVFDTTGISENIAHRDIHTQERYQFLHSILPSKVIEHFEQYKNIENLLNSKRFQMLKKVELTPVLRKLLHIVLLILSLFSKKLFKIW